MNGICKSKIHIFEFNNNFNMVSSTEFTYSILTYYFSHFSPLLKCKLRVVILTQVAGISTGPNTQCLKWRNVLRVCKCLLSVEYPSMSWAKHAAKYVWWIACKHCNILVTVFTHFYQLMNQLNQSVDYHVDQLCRSIFNFYMKVGKFLRLQML